jgi:hypothetical protein
LPRFLSAYIIVCTSALHRIYSPISSSLCSGKMLAVDNRIVEL